MVPIFHRRQDSEGRTRNGKRKLQQPRQNTAVYVTGLPLDATVDEVHELFSRKCGVVAEEIDSGRPRIKMYTDADGNFKGDALVVFFKPQSVDMAVMLLDDTDFRFTSSGLTSGKMRVQPADLSYKKTSYDEAVREKDDRADGGTSENKTQDSGGQASGNSSGAGRSAGDKQKIIKKTQKLAAKLSDWDDDDPSAMPLDVEPLVKAGRVVILRHMFTLAELEEDPAALLDIKEDIRDECAKLGQVTNVVLYDLEEDGVVTVKFKTVEAAQACVDLMNGRAFGGRTVEAVFATGKEKYKKSKKADQDDDDAEGD
jgi:HIV Tat-specific factor 1